MLSSDGMLVGLHSNLSQCLIRALRLWEKKPNQKILIRKPRELHKSADSCIERRNGQTLDVLAPQLLTCRRFLLSYLRLTSQRSPKTTFISRLVADIPFAVPVRP